MVHVLVCSLLMNLGKIFPAFCYRSEVHIYTRLALAIGMMPRGEVCAGIIVNAIALGLSGATSGFFAIGIALLVTQPDAEADQLVLRVRRETSTGAAGLP